MLNIRTYIPKELIDELKERFPHRCPKRGESLEDVLRYAGKVELIEFLEACKKEYKEYEGVNIINVSK